MASGFLMYNFLIIFLSLQNLLALDWVRHAADIGGEEWNEIKVILLHLLCFVC